MSLILADIRRSNHCLQNQTSKRSNRLIPLIGSICKGPIGISQLPRTWWKAVTRAVGVLDSEYPDKSGGLDTWCLEHLELNIDETYDYLRSELPDYVTFESWVVDQKGGKVHAAKIARFNQIIVHRQHIRPNKITETYADIGFDPDVDTYTSALLLNTLQDWQLFHARDLGYVANAGSTPLISSLDLGPMGVMQLARTWQKVLLDAKGLLHDDYPAFGGGLDRSVIEALGLNQEETLDYLRNELPTYMGFERWIQGRAGDIDHAKVEQFQNHLLQREHKGPKLADIHERTGCDPGITNGVLLNHLEDWRYAYDLIVAPHRND